MGDFDIDKQDMVCILDFWQKHCKFVCGNPCYGIACPHGCSQLLRHQLKGFVVYGIGIADCVGPIQTNTKHAQISSVAFSLQQGLICSLRQKVAIGQSGWAVA